MNTSRIYAIVLRHLLLTFRSFNRIINTVYWPTVNIIIWGVTSVWLQHEAQYTSLSATILTGLIFWQIVFKVNLETAKCLLEELLNHNLLNLFSSPLTLSEWIISVMLLGVLNMVLVVFCCIIVAWLLYTLNIFKLGFMIIPFMISLLISGWFIGFFICGLLIYWGLKAQDSIYIIGWLFAPFSAVYYPVVALPYWAQKIALMLPTTYIFEGMRQILLTHTFDKTILVKSFSLNTFYLSASLIFFKYMFEKSKQKGLLT